MKALNLKDILAGAIFILFGGIFLIAATTTLEIGTAFRMGPGYFPILLSGILVAFGLAIVVRGLRGGSGPLGTIAWRSLILITLAVIVLGSGMRPLGLVPALWLSLVLACFASRKTTLPLSIAVSTAVTAFCALVFVYALGLPIPLLGSWFG